MPSGLHPEAIERQGAQPCGAVGEERDGPEEVPHRVRVEQDADVLEVHERDPPARRIGSAAGAGVRSRWSVEINLYQTAAYRSFACLHTLSTRPTRSTKMTSAN